MRLNQSPLLERITINPEIRAGRPTFKGTRLTVEHILNWLSHSSVPEQILADLFETKLERTQHQTQSWVWWSIVVGLAVVGLVVEVTGTIACPGIQAQEAQDAAQIQREAEQQQQLEQISVATQKGNITQALDTLKSFQAQYPDVEMDIYIWDNLCYYGALYGKADLVLFACDHAAQFENPYTYSHRGLARALTGDFGRAIEDFELFLSAKDEDNYFGISEQEEATHQAWIRALQSGQNPFTPQLRPDLRTE
ncbi:DUF433 domain-containing protein [Prochlorothrix hollandica]|uniref:DUF433 domain-containing protein n=1 Tax=Prochlorothrix hollandica TaxID=1223 RepID=UPI003342935C